MKFISYVCIVGLVYSGTSLGMINTYQTFKTAFFEHFDNSFRLLDIIQRLADQEKENPKHTAVHELKKKALEDFMHFLPKEQMLSAKNYFGNLWKILYNALFYRLSITNESKVILKNICNYTTTPNLSPHPKNKRALIYCGMLELYPNLFWHMSRKNRTYIASLPFEFARKTCLTSSLHQRIGSITIKICTCEDTDHDKFVCVDGRTGAEIIEDQKKGMLFGSVPIFTTNQPVTLITKKQNNA